MKPDVMTSLKATVTIVKFAIYREYCIEINQLEVPKRFSGNFEFVTYIKSMTKYEF